MSSIIYNGHEIKDIIVNGNQAQLWLNGHKLYPTEEPSILGWNDGRVTKEIFE